MYKQPPLWIINDTLLFFLVVTVLFIMVTREKIPARKQLTVSQVAIPTLKDVSKIDTTRIYRNDLFNTSRESDIEETPQKEKTLELPPPPTPRKAPIVEPVPVQFLDPLPVTLKGIMFSTIEQHNRAVIEQNASKKEKLYKVGDTIEDAEIIRIYYNKIILVRSNGQQETLFVSPQDAQLDPSYKQEPNWTGVIEQDKGGEFIIHRKKFMNNVKNLAEFIDMLDITTAYRKGVSLGCRIGSLKSTSVGALLGLQPNDIVLTIAQIPTASTNDRVAIFTKVKELNDGDTFAAVVLRHEQEITLKYKIADPAPVQTEQDERMEQDVRLAHEAGTKLVKQAQVQKNPMANHVHNQTVNAMKNYTGRSSLMEHVPSS